MGLIRLLVRAYPPSFRRRFGDEMLETAEKSHPGVQAQFGVAADLLVGAAKEWMEVLMEQRTILATASAVNAVGGLLLMGGAFFSEGLPWQALVLGLVLLVQGAYTLLYLGGLLAGRGLRLLIVGETLAALVGALGFITGALRNVNPPGGDYEYGPMTIAFLLAMQAALALWAAGGRRPMSTG